MKEYRLNCNSSYAIREDGFLISYIGDVPKIMKSYKNKYGKDIVDIRVNGKYKHVQLQTLMARYFPAPIPIDFKPIPGYGGRFYANKDGDILSESVLSASNKGRRLLKQCLDGNGYKIVTLNGKSKHVHRLIALTFIPNPNNLPCINHKDENKLNNNVENLEWCTHEYNMNYNCLGIRRAEDNSKHIKVTDIHTNTVTIYRNKNHCSDQLGFAVATITKYINNKQIFKHYKFDYE